MDPKALCALLARQIDAARHATLFKERDGRVSRLFPALLRSLRVTYLAASGALDIPCEIPSLYVLERGAAGDLILRRYGLPVPVDPAFLMDLFASAGIQFAPRQRLLLDPEIANDAIEETLRRSRGLPDPEEEAA